MSSHFREPEPSDPRCGTPAGYQAHYDHGTPRCRLCLDAQADWQRHYRTRLYLAGGPMLIDATGTRRRVQALMRIGWTADLMAAELGVTGAAVRAWTTTAKVRRSTAARVAALYDRWWNQPGPSVRTRSRARAAGWAPPLAWDDDRIDDRRARPNWGARLPTAFDEIAVQRALHGDAVHLRPVERAEAVRRLTAAGRSAADIAALLGTTKRSVVRHRATDTREAS
jgi:DNA-binding CsgD family transcriptional regulator